MLKNFILEKKYTPNEDVFKLNVTKLKIYNMEDRRKYSNVAQRDKRKGTMKEGHVVYQ